MAKIITDEQKINTVLTKGTEEAIDRESLDRKLKSGKQLRIKFGVDPTAPNLHLGHSVPLRKLKEFQNLGHKAILIIGDFTAMIGDPTGKSETRKPLTEREVKENLKKYLKQAGKIIDIKKTEVHYNSEWLDKLKGAKILELLSLVSVQQMTEREDFHKRISEHKPVRIHEFFYPILQAYDSVITKPDIELGGTDQKFNFLMGRDLMGKFKLPSQDIITVPLLEGLDGVRKMSKSFGNYIGITDSADDKFGKIMSIPDNIILKYFELLTDFTENEILEIKNKMEGGENPRDIKMRLAEEIVKLYHNEREAEKAKENFIKVFSRKEIPEEAENLDLKENKNIIETLFNSGVFSSKSEIRRLTEGGGLKINGDKIGIDYIIKKDDDGKILQIGKKKFYRIKINN